MFPIRNNQVREFCKEVLDVDYIEYVSDWHIIKRKLDCEKHYVELAELFSYNSDALDKGKTPFVRMSVDESGFKYAQLSEECKDHAYNNDFSLIPEWKERDKRNVPLRKALSKFVDYSLEDRICEKCKNPLVIDSSEREYKDMINKLVNKDTLNDSHDVKIPKDSLSYTFLRSKIILGGYADINEIDGYKQKKEWTNIFLKFKDIDGEYLN